MSYIKFDMGSFIGFPQIWTFTVIYRSLHNYEELRCDVACLYLYYIGSHFQQMFIYL